MLTANAQVMTKTTTSIRLGRFAAFAATIYRPRSIPRHLPLSHRWHRRREWGT